MIPKLDVAGSTPVSRSNFFNDLHSPASPLCSVCAPITSLAGFSLAGLRRPVCFQQATAYIRSGSRRDYGRADRRPTSRPLPASASKVACVRRITRKFAQPKPTFASFGYIDRRKQLSLDRGVIRSDGKTQASSRVSTENSRQPSISRSSPSERAVFRTDWFVFGESICVAPSADTNS